MANNLGVILRKLIGVGKPSEWTSMRAFAATCAALWSTILAVLVAASRRIVEIARRCEDQLLGSHEQFSDTPEAASSTGCYGRL
jgi:hypothetical protein